MSDDRSIENALSTPDTEITALAQQVATARGKIGLQHDTALYEALSAEEIRAERELAEWIRAQRRKQRRRAVADELDADQRDRRTGALIRRADEADARWHRKALAARRRVSSADARLAQLYRRSEWSSRALIGVVVLGMVWAGVNVQRNLVPSGDMSDPLYWLSYGIEAMISIPIITIMVAATTAARWGRELERGKVLLFELALLGTTVALNAGPHLAAGSFGRAAEYAIAPVMVGVVIWLHAWVSARYALLIESASVELPGDQPVYSPAERLSSSPSFPTTPVDIPLAGRAVPNVLAAQSPASDVVGARAHAESGSGAAESGTLVGDYGIVGDDVDSAANTGAGTHADAGTDTDAGTNAGAGVDADAETGAGAEAGADADAGANAETGVGADAGTSADADMGADTNPGADAGARADASAGARAGADADAVANTDADAGANTDANVNAATGAGKGTDAGTSTGVNVGADAGGGMVASAGERTHVSRGVRRVSADKPTAPGTLELIHKAAAEHRRNGNEHAARTSVAPMRRIPVTTAAQNSAGDATGTDPVPEATAHAGTVARDRNGDTTAPTESVVVQNHPQVPVDEPEQLTLTTDPDPLSSASKQRHLDFEPASTTQRPPAESVTAPTTAQLTTTQPTPGTAPHPAPATDQLATTQPAPAEDQLATTQSADDKRPIASESAAGPRSQPEPAVAEQDRAEAELVPAEDSTPTDDADFDEPDIDPHDFDDDTEVRALARQIATRSPLRLTLDQIEEILELTDQSWTARSIGAEVGVSGSTVTNIVDFARKIRQPYAFTG